MPSGFGGLAEGLWGSVQNTRAENAALEAASREREAKVYAVLAESDDPEIRNMAVAGMLEMGNPRSRAKGMRGFLGEMEQSETLPKIRALLNTPIVKQKITPGLPSRGLDPNVAAGAAPGPVAPRAPGAAAMPSGSMVTGTAPPATTPGAPPPTTGQSPFTVSRATPAVGRVDQVSEPRQVFLDPDEKMRRTTLAREDAEIQARVDAMRKVGIPEAEIQQAIRAYVGGRYGAGRFSGLQKQAVEITQPDGTTLTTFAVFNPNDGGFYDPDTQQRLENARPVSRDTRISYGVANESAAKAVFGKSFHELTQAQQNEIVTKHAPAFARGMNYERGRGSGDAQIETKFNTPLSPDEAAQQGVAIGTTPAQMTGQTPQTSQHEELRRNSAMLKEMLPNVKLAIREAFPSKTELFGNIAPGVVMRARRLDPSKREAIAKMESAVNLLVNNIARVVGGAKGAQSEKDAMRAEAAIANLKEGWIQGDTAESAEARIDEAMAAIDAVVASLPPEIVPTQVPGTAPSPGKAAVPGSNPAPAAAPAGPSKRAVGDEFQHPVHGWVVVESINPATGKPVVRKIAGPTKK